MAFVFRSERGIMQQLNSQNNNLNNENEINLNTISKDNIIKDTDLINHRYKNIIDPPAPPFLSGVERTKIQNDENSPGPGTYNISEGYYNKHRQFSSRQENTKPEEYEIFDIPLFRMRGVINNNPGPGHYNPSEKDLFGGRFKIKNKPKLLINRNNKSSLSNISHSLNNIFKKDINKENSHSIEINKNMNKLVLIYSSKRRKGENEQIINKEQSPKKVNDCGEIMENFSMKNIRPPPLSIKTSESANKTKNNIGIRNNNSKLSGITLDTERTSINTSKLSYSQIRNKSSKLIQNLKKQLNNNNNNQDLFLYNNIITEQNVNKSNTLFPTSLKYDKSRIYKNEYNHDRLLKSKEQNTNYSINYTEFDKLLNSEYYSQSPGPGYYDPIDLPYQKYYKPNNNLNYFNRFKGKNVTSLVKIKKPKNMSPGPGAYKNDNNMIENKIKNKKIRDLLFDVKKIEKLRLLREKETLERNEDNIILKEKNYFNSKSKCENNSKEIFEENAIDYRKMHCPKDLLFNFGSNEKRLPDIKQNNYPGPGEYDVDLYKSIEEKNSNIKESPNYQQLYDKTENKSNLIERTSLNKNLINNPPVGYYDPDIISSIKYNYEYKNKMKPPIRHKSEFNPYLERLTLEKVKEIKEKEKELINHLGPGKYYNILSKSFNNINICENKPPFGSSEKKLEFKKKDIYPGPGQYNVDSYYNWITRTYNILFS